jgi:hypothetical protein
MKVSRDRIDTVLNYFIVRLNNTGSEYRQYDKQANCFTYSFHLSADVRVGVLGLQNVRGAV